jgi:hypothetical protein
MAEMLAWPERSGVRTVDEAIRRALIRIPFSDKWPEEKRERTVRRLRKKFEKKGDELKAAALAKSVERVKGGLPPGPLYPSLIDVPSDPEVAVLWRGLWNVRQWVSELLALVEQQSEEGEINPDCRKHARALIRLVEREQERAATVE